MVYEPQTSLFLSYKSNIPLFLIHLHSIQSSNFHENKTVKANKTIKLVNHMSKKYMFNLRKFKAESSGSEIYAS